MIKKLQRFTTVRHFGKHGVEAGATREQYAQDALAWARNPAGTGKPIQLKDGTEGPIILDPASGAAALLGHNRWGNVASAGWRQRPIRRSEEGGALPSIHRSF